MFVYDNDLDTHYTAQIIHLTAGKRKNFHMQESVVLFGICGDMFLKSGDYDEVCVKENEMIFIHAGFSFTITAMETFQGLLLSFPEILPLCNRYIPEVIEHKKYTCETLFYSLPIRKYLEVWLSSLHTLVAELKDHHSLVKVKTQELFLLMKLCYPNDELTNFLCPVFSYNYDFTLFILNNYYKVKTVSELAELSSLSLSGFEKEFRKVFGTSPYRWMLRKKMKKLHYEISATDKLFKVIAEEYGFVSLSQLGDFCRKHFGASPRDIRNKKIQIK